MNQSNNCEENTNRTSINQILTKTTSDNAQSINSVNPIIEQVAITKGNSTSVKSNNRRSEKSKNQISKAKPEIESNIEVIEDTMLT